jgi:hypothetical protein
MRFYDEICESVVLGLIERCGLVNVMTSMNPDDPPPPTRCDSKRRVDFIFATSGIHKNIIRYGMLPKDSIFYSDNCALYIDIAVKPQFSMDSLCPKFIVNFSVEILQLFQNTRTVFKKNWHITPSLNTLML